MSGGRASKRKGDRFEREIVNCLRAAGMECARVPLSGAAGGEFGSDVRLTFLGEPRTAECKCRADGFRELYKWIGGNDALFLKADRQEPLVVLRMSDFIRLSGGEAPANTGSAAA